jgi:hypothetical protein
MRKIIVFYILIFLLTGCKKERELITGDILGRITVYNQDGSISDNLAGITVNLFRDNSIVNHSISDENGQYRFKEIAYGKYSISLERENYIEREVDYSIYHIGGYSPTIRDAVIYEIPAYVMSIDSSLFYPENYRLKLYLKVDGKTVIPFYNYRVIGYCSTSADVSPDNYAFIISGRVTSETIYAPHDAAGEIYNNVWKLNTADTWYIRFYLQAFGQNLTNTINTETLGKPSNVITFKWH